MPLDRPFPVYGAGRFQLVAGGEPIRVGPGGHGLTAGGEGPVVLFRLEEADDGRLAFRMSPTAPLGPEPLGAPLVGPLLSARPKGSHPTDRRGHQWHVERRSERSWVLRSPLGDRPWFLGPRPGDGPSRVGLVGQPFEWAVQGLLPPASWWRDDPASLRLAPDPPSLAAYTSR